MSIQAMAIGQLVPYPIPSVNSANLSSIDKVAWQTSASNVPFERVEQILKSIDDSNRGKKKQFKRDISTYIHYTPTSSSLIHPNESSRQNLASFWQQQANIDQYKSNHPFLTHLDNNYDHQSETTQSQVDIYGLSNNQMPIVYNENLQPHQQPLPNRRFHYSNQQHKNKKPVYAPINQQTVNGILSLLLLFIISICGCIGTIFIMSALTVIESLQTRGNCYLVSLALSHLLVTLIVIPSSALQIMAGDGIDERRLCHYQWLVLEFSFIVGQLSFFLIAADNYLGYKSSEKIVATADSLNASINGTGRNLESNIQNPLSSSPQMLPHHQTAINQYTSYQADKQIIEVDHSIGQTSKNTSPSINVPLLQTSEYSIDEDKRQAKVQLRPSKNRIKNFINNLFSTSSGQTTSCFDSPISLLINDPNLANNDNKQKLRLAHQIAGAELSKQSCFRYKSCCGRLRVVIWILIIWSIAFAYTLHQHELSYGPKFCTISSKHKTINNTQQQHKPGRLQQVSLAPVIAPSNVKLKTRSLDSEENINELPYKLGNEIDELRSAERASVSDINQQHYLASKSKSSSNKEGPLQFNLSFQEVSTKTQTLALANPLQRLAIKAVQVGELTALSSPSRLGQTEITWQKRSQSSGSINKKRASSISQVIGEGRGKEELLSKRDEKLRAPPLDCGTLSESEEKHLARTRRRGRRTSSVLDCDELNFANSQMTSREVDQLKAIETLPLNAGSGSEFKYGSNGIKGQQQQQQRDGDSSQLITGNLHSSDNRSSGIYDMDNESENDYKDSNQNAIKETIHPLEPVLKSIWPTSLFAIAKIVPTNKAKFGEIRGPKKGDVNSAKIDTKLHSLPRINNLQVVFVQNKLKDEPQADEAIANLNTYAKQKEVVGYVYNNHENNGLKRNEIVNKRELRRANEIRARETTQRSNCDSCHRNKKGASYVGKLGELVDKTGEVGQQNWLIGNSSWPLQLSDGSLVSSGKQTMSNYSNNNGKSSRDSSGTEVRSGNSDLDSNSNNYKLDDEKDGSRGNNNDNCAHVDNKLEFGCSSRFVDKSNGKVSEQTKDDRASAAGNHSNNMRTTFTGSKSSYDIDMGTPARSTTLPGVSIYPPSVSSPHRADKFDGGSSTDLLDREFQANKEVLSHEEEKEKEVSKLVRVRLKRQMLSGHFIDDDDFAGGGDRQNGQIDSNLSARYDDDDGDERMSEGKDVKVEDKPDVESFYEGQDSNNASDESEDEEKKGVLVKVGAQKKVERVKNGVKRKELHRQKLMNNNSGISGMQITFRFTSDASGLSEVLARRVSEKEGRVRLFEQHYLNSGSDSDSNLNFSLDLNSNSNSKPSKTYKLIDDSMERQFNKRSLNSLDSSLPGADVGPPSSLQINGLASEPNNASSITSLSSPSANKNNSNNINNLVVVVVTTIEPTLDLNHNQASATANTVSLANSQLMINNSTQNNFQNKSQSKMTTTTTTSRDYNQQQRPKYYWFMLFGAIVIPNLASAILFARAYLKMKEFKTRTHKPIPLAAAALSANLPAILMPNSPLPILPQHQTYTFSLSNKDSVENSGSNDVAYNDTSCDNNKPASEDCQNDSRNYNQSEEIAIVSLNRKKEDNNNDENNNSNEHDEANNDDLEVLEITSSHSDENSIKEEQQIKSPVFRDEQDMGEHNKLAGNQDHNNAATTTTTTNRADYDWSGDHNINTEQFYQNRRSLSQPNGSSSAQQIPSHHYYEDHFTKQQQKVAPNYFSPVTSLIEQAQIKQGRNHRQVNQVMSAPLGYDQYLFHQFHRPVPASSEAQEKEWVPQQVRLGSPSEPPPGYLDGRPNPNRLNLNCYPKNQQQEVFLINANRVESSNLNNATHGRNGGDISFSAPPSATFRQQDTHSSEEVFAGPTGPNQNHCLPNDTEIGQMSGSNDLRLQQQHEHEPVYEFRRRRHHAQSFHYGSSSRSSQCFSALPTNHGALSENEQWRQQQLAARIHQTVVLQPVCGSGSPIHNVQPIESSVHQRSPVANFQQHQQQQQQHLLERHRSLPRSSRLHQSESGQPHLATIEAEARITAPPSETHQRLPLRQQFWQQQQQKQQSEHQSGIQQCQAGVGRGFDSSLTQPRPGYITGLETAIDDPYSPSETSSQWFQEDEINSKQQQKQKLRQNKQNSSETNKQLQLQLQARTRTRTRLHQHQHQSSKTEQLARVITDSLTTTDCTQMEAVMLASTTMPTNTTPTTSSTTTNNATNLTTTVVVTSVAATSNSGGPKQSQQQNQQVQFEAQSSKQQSSSSRQSTQTFDHSMIQQQPRRISLKASPLNHQTLSHEPLNKNKQTKDNGANRNKATLCAYSYMTDDQLLKSNIIVFILNLTLWLPFIVLSIVIQYREHLTQEFKDSVWWMATLNCCSCSYVYALTNKDFREAFNKLFYYCCCKSHVTFQKKTPIFRRQLDIDSKGNLRIHIIPGLNIYSNKLVSTGLEPVIGSGGGINSNYASTIINHSLGASLIHPYIGTNIAQSNVEQSRSSSPVGIGLNRDNTGQNYKFDHHKYTNDQQQNNRQYHRSSTSHVYSSINAPQSSQALAHRSPSYRASGHIAPGTGFGSPLSQATSEAIVSSSGQDNQASNHYRSHGRSIGVTYSNSQTSSGAL